MLTHLGGQCGHHYHIKYRDNKTHDDELFIKDYVMNQSNCCLNLSISFSLNRTEFDLRDYVRRESVSKYVSSRAAGVMFV